MSEVKDLKRPRQNLEAEEILALLEGIPNAQTEQGLTEHDLDSETVQATLKELCSHWSNPPNAEQSILETAAERFGVLEQFKRRELVPFGENGLKRLYNKKQLCLVRLRYHFVRLGILDLDESATDVTGAAFKAMFTRAHECLHRLFDTLMMSLLTLKCLDPMWARDCPAGEDPYNIRAFDPAKLSLNQQFLAFVLENAQKLGLRRYKKACYIEIDSPPMNVNGTIKTFKTHAWKRYMDISEFVNKCAPKETHLVMWQASVDGPAKNRAIDELEKGYDIQFPVLEPDRFYHAFHNGIYDVINKRFYSWGHTDISAHIVCCKYHERIFDTSILSFEDWRDIPTPAFDTILRLQLEHYTHLEVERRPGSKKEVLKKWTLASAEAENERLRSIFEQKCDLARTEGWSEEEIAYAIKCDKFVEPGTNIATKEGHKIIDWVYIEGGRILYPVNYLDTWQHMPMFIGRAGTGKSLILSTWAKFFDDADVAVIANDVQAGFGLETVWNSFVWMIKEVKSDLKLEQSQLQSMITGEEMSIARKGLPAIQIVWKSPGVMAGNELANWTDNSGSMSRRILLFYFRKFVTNSDPKLSQRLMEELPNLIHKSNMAYAEACSLYGHCDIWGRDPVLKKKFEDHPELEQLHRGATTILPTYFHNNKGNFKQQTHPMENFLGTADEIAVVGKDSGYGMPFDTETDGRQSFRSLANTFFKKQDPKPFPWSKSDRYVSTLEDFGLELRKLVAADNRSFCGFDYPVDTMWIFGVLPRKEAETLNLV